MVTDRLKAQISGHHLLHNLKKQIGLSQLRQKLTKFEMLKNLAGIALSFSTCSRT